MPALRTERHDGVTTLTLDRPGRANALNAELVEELILAVDEAKARGTRLLVIAGEGEGFCGGFDFEDISAASDGDLLLRFVRIETLLQSVRHFPAPTVAFAHSYAWGAGADLFCACRTRIAAPGSRFSFPGARFGVVLGTRHLARIVGEEHALSIISGGRPLLADDAVKIGLVTALAARSTWKADIVDSLSRKPLADAWTTARLMSRLTVDTRAEDMAVLVASAGRAGLKQRMLAYGEAVGLKRAGTNRDISENELRP